MKPCVPLKAIKAKDWFPIIAQIRIMHTSKKFTLRKPGIIFSRILKIFKTDSNFSILRILTILNRRANFSIEKLIFAVYASISDKSQSTTIEKSNILDFL